VQISENRTANGEETMQVEYVLPQAKPWMIKLVGYDPRLLLLVEQVQQNAPVALQDEAKLQSLLSGQDCAAHLVSELQKVIHPEDVFCKTPMNTQQARSWTWFGMYFQEQAWNYEALYVYEALYDHMLRYQNTAKDRTHKGLPLVKIGECHRALDRPVHAKRYAMLALCEDAISGSGTLNLNETDTYFRLTCQYGLSSEQIKRYAARCWELYGENPEEALYPEWLLQNLDQGWMTEIPTPIEMGAYCITKDYCEHLLGRLGRTVTSCAAGPTTCTTTGGSHSRSSKVPPTPDSTADKESRTLAWQRQSRSFAGFWRLRQPTVGRPSAFTGFSIEPTSQAVGWVSASGGRSYFREFADALDKPPSGSKKKTKD
jgi:hypothetical protein